MENPRNFSGNTLGNNATVNQGNVTHVIVNTDIPNKDKSFLQEISKTDPFYDKKRILMLKGPLLWDSFSWILSHPEFSMWRHSEDGGIFWIKGDPGKGKTMLLCGIIEDLEQNSQSENLSYFFCQAADYRINTATAVIGGLITSLLKKQPRLLSRIRENYRDGLKDQLDGANALVILCDIFETIADDPDLTDVICVVDALDECIKDCRHLLSLIIKTSGRVKWLLSSRNEKDIEKMLDQVPQRLILELKQNAERISTSIDAYIRHHIHEIEALKDDKRLQERTLAMLKSKAQGTFLWVALVVEQLHNAGRWEVENVLEEVPKDLENLYGQMLDRWKKLGERRQEVCQVLLSIITAAKRPLHLGELLVFINSHWKDVKNIKTTYELRDVQDMAKTCGSILSIREDIVYFIHQSAKDYIMENAAQRVFPIQHQHYKMFEASLDAMSNVLEYDIYGLEDPAIHIDDVPLKDVGSDPLASIRYCCAFWVEHLVSGYSFEGFEHHKYLKDNGRLHYFLREKFLCWIESLTLVRSFYPQAQVALQKLGDLISEYCGSRNIDSEISQAIKLQRECETYCLRQFTDDAYRFVENSKESVARWPLQLYFSAMSFGQDNCIVRKTFERTVYEKFGPSPILASFRHGQYLRLQSSFPIPGELLHSIDLSHSPNLVFSPDSSLIGRMFEEEFMPALRFWKVDSGVLECSFPITLGSKIAFFPNSDEFISVSPVGIMKRWSMDKRSCIGEQSLEFTYGSFNTQFRSRFNSMGRLESLEEIIIALSPKGDLAASWHRKSSDGRGLVRIWDTEAACCCNSFEFDKQPYLCATFSPDSQLLALSFSDSIKVHNTKTGAKIKYLNSLIEERETRAAWKRFNEGTKEPQHAWFAPNSKVLVTMVSKWQLCLWDTHTWELLHSIKHSQQFQPLKCLDISPDSMVLATNSSREIKLWSIDTGECVAKVAARSLSMSFAPNWTKSSLVAIQQQSSTIQTWFVDTRQTVPEPQDTDYVFDDVIISPDSKFVASGHKHHNEIYIWSGDDSQLIHVLKMELLGHKTSHEPLIFSPDSQLLAYASSRCDFPRIQIWDVVTGESVCLLRCQNSREFSSAAFSSNAEHLVAGTFNGEIYVWRLDAGQLIRKCQFHNTSGDLLGGLITSISPESTYVAAFWDPGALHARIWQLYSENTVVIYPGPEILAEYSGQGSLPIPYLEAKIAFSSDSAILAYVTKSKAEIFDVTTGACLECIYIRGSEHLRLLSFDPINGRVFTTKSVFYKTFSWKDWETSPRFGYSYDYCVNDYSSRYWKGYFWPDLSASRGVWILLDGKRNCYVPSNFRPSLLALSKNTTNVAITDSLLAILNELGDVVIIKLPARRGGTTTSVGAFDFGSALQHIFGSADTSYLVAHAPATSGSGMTSLKRRRNISGASSLRE